MAEQDNVDAPGRVGRGETKQAVQDDSGPGAPGAAPQPIEATTAALGDMEPSAGSGGASRAETDDDDDTGRV